MEDHKKVIWLAHEGNLSGANYCMLEYIQILEQHGFHSIIILPFKGTLYNKAIELNIQVLQEPFYGWAKPADNPTKFMGFKIPIRNFVAVRKLEKLFKKLAPDYVATNTIVTPVAAYAANRSGIKHVWFVHEFGEEDHNFTIAGRFSRGATLIGKYSFKVALNSNAVISKFRPYLDPKQISLVQNPVLIKPAFVGQENGKERFTFIILGQISIAKNHVEAIQALGVCKAKGYNFKITIVGKAEDERILETLKSAIATFGLKDDVLFTGPTSDPVSSLVNSNALIMCSRNEAFGRVTVEALKCGLPVVAANSGGSPELIEEGLNGFLYSQGNPDDLADKMIQLFKEYSSFDTKEIANSAQKRFNEENTFKQLCQVFS